jgi:hypothetical protein
MNELSLESLAKRIEALEHALAARDAAKAPKDWRKVVGIFRDSEFMIQVDEEGRKIREAERAQARQEQTTE